MSIKDFRVLERNPVLFIFKTLLSDNYKSLSTNFPGCSIQIVFSEFVKHLSLITIKIRETEFIWCQSQLNFICL